jgi:hypothetical protein
LHGTVGIQFHAIYMYPFYLLVRVPV